MRLKIFLLHFLLLIFLSVSTDCFGGTKEKAADVQKKETAANISVSAQKQAAVIQMLAAGDQETRRARFESLMRIGTALAKKSPPKEEKKTVSKSER